MNATLMIGVSWLALTAPAWGSGNDRFNAGIDAERPGFSTDTSTHSTASDIDRDTSSDGLTARDREVMASLTNSAWGTLVSISNNQAKYQQDGRTYLVDLEPPAPKPMALATPAPASPAPLVDMGTISAPPLQMTPSAPTIAPAPDLYTTPQISPPQPDPVAQIVEERPRKNTHFSDLDKALRAIGKRRINQPKPGTPMSFAERQLARAINLAAGAGMGAFVGGNGLTQRRKVEGAVFGMATAEAKRYWSGKTPFDGMARNLLHMNAKEWRTHERVARRLSKPERQRLIDTARDVVRENRRERREQRR